MERAADRVATTRNQTLTFLVLLALTLSSSSLAAQTAKLAASHSVGRTVVVSIPDRKLAVIENRNVIATFSVAVGAQATPSPTGQFQIVNRVSNPNYYRPGAVIPSGKDNPVGTRWVGLSQKGYGIHGTNAPKSVGHAASHGCIRLRNRDMERLFAMLQVGDAVEIHGERDEQVAQVFGNSAEDTTVAEKQVTDQDGGQWDTAAKSLTKAD